MLLLCTESVENALVAAHHHDSLDDAEIEAGLVYAGRWVCVDS